MSLGLPQPVLSIMHEQFRVAVRLAQESYQDTKADEDAVTGALIANIRNQVRGSAEDGGSQYRWQTRLTKLRGRGPGADEKEVGADAIFEVTVDAGDGQGKLQKVLLMQAKIEWRGTDRSLETQCQKMEKAAPRMGVVVDYGPKSYTGAAAGNVVKAERNRKNMNSTDIMPLAGLLGKEFLECRIGVVGAYFDAVRKQIALPAGKVTALAVRYRARIYVTQSGRRP